MEERPCSPAGFCVRLHLHQSSPETPAPGAKSSMGTTTTPSISTPASNHSHSKDCHTAETNHRPARRGQADTERAYSFADAPTVRYRMQSSRQGRAAADPMLGGPVEARWSQSRRAEFSFSPQAFTSPLAASKSQRGLWLGPGHPARTMLNRQTQALLGSRLWAAKPHPWWWHHQASSELTD